MSNDPYANLTDEEKALLQREMKYRIEQQRRREQYPNWLTRPMFDMPMGRRVGAILSLVGIVLIVSYVVMSRPNALLLPNPYVPILLFAGAISTLIGLVILARFWK